MSIHVTHTQLEPDILGEVKWAIGNITMNKASGGDGIPAELFRILKDNAVNSAEFIMSANSKNSAVATGLEKISFHSNPKEEQYQRTIRVPDNCTRSSC